MDNLTILTDAIEQEVDYIKEYVNESDDLGQYDIMEAGYKICLADDIIAYSENYLDDKEIEEKILNKLIKYDNNADGILTHLLEVWQNSKSDNQWEDKVDMFSNL